MLDVLCRQRSEQLFGVRIHDEERAESPRRQLRGGRSNTGELFDQLLLPRERISRDRRGEPALCRSGVRQRILAGPQKPEHRIKSLPGPSIAQQQVRFRGRSSGDTAIAGRDRISSLPVNFRFAA